MIVQTKEQQPEMKLIEDEEREIKPTKDNTMQTEDEELKDKSELCNFSYNRKLIPYHLHENSLCDLCSRCEEYNN